jgi:hypothetical protein
LTDTQLADLARSERPWNIARRTFATYAARLSAIFDESFNDKTVDDIRATSNKIRRIEFEAVAQIGKALGVLVHDVGGAIPAAPNPDPAGLRKWLGPAPEPEPAPEARPLGASRGAGGGASTGPGREPPLGPENMGKDPPGKGPDPAE